LPDICTGIFDGRTETKFKTLMNRSPLNRPEVSAKIIAEPAGKARQWSSIAKEIW